MERVPTSRQQDFHNLATINHKVPSLDNQLITLAEQPEATHDFHCLPPLVHEHVVAAPALPSRSSVLCCRIIKSGLLAVPYHGDDIRGLITRRSSPSLSRRQRSFAESRRQPSVALSKRQPSALCRLIEEAALFGLIKDAAHCRLFP